MILEPSSSEMEATKVVKASKAVGASKVGEASNVVEASKVVGARKVGETSNIVEASKVVEAREVVEASKAVAALKIAETSHVVEASNVVEASKVAVASQVVEVSEAVEASEVEPDESFCRLKSNLNPQCLSEIFKLVDVTDLITLSKMDNYFRLIINRLVIPEIPICLKRLNDRYQRILRAFGKRISRLILHFDDGLSPEQFVTIINGLTIGQLTEVNFVGHPNPKFNWILMSTYSDYFKNVRSVRISKINCARQSATLRKCLIEPLMEKMRKLRKLRFDFVLAERSWFDSIWNLDVIKNLTELHLNEVRCVWSKTPQSILYLLEKGPKLRCFINKDSIEHSDIGMIGEALVKYCGDSLTTFCDIDRSLCLWLPQKGVDNILRRYTFISQLKKLKELTLITLLPCGSDLHNAVKDLAGYGNLEKLRIETFNEFRTPPKVPQISPLPISHNYPALRTFEIDSRRKLKFFEKNSQQLLQNVETFICNGSSVNYIKSMPKLKTLVFRYPCWFYAMEAFINAKVILNERKYQNHVENPNDSIVLSMKETTQSTIHVAFKIDLNLERLRTMDFIVESTSKLTTNYEKPDQWSTIQYYEYENSKNPPFKTTSHYIRFYSDIKPKMFLGNLTTMGPITVSRKNLSSVQSRNNELFSLLQIESPASRYCEGTSLGLFGVDLEMECSSGCPVYMQCQLFNRLRNLDSNSVLELFPGTSIKLFNVYEFFFIFEQTLARGQDAIGELLEMCKIRMSFGDPWGPYFRKYDVKLTACWVEVKLDFLTDWIKCVIQQMMDMKSNDD